MPIIKYIYLIYIGALFSILSFNRKKMSIQFNRTPSQKKINYNTNYYKVLRLTFFVELVNRLSIFINKKRTVIETVPFYF